jgi:hypothetical protein
MGGVSCCVADGECLRKVRWQSTATQLGPHEVAPDSSIHPSRHELPTPPDPLFAVQGMADLLELAAASAALVQACCAALDAAAGTQLSTLCARLVADVAGPAQRGGRAKEFVIPRGPWEYVRREVLPRLAAACEECTAASRGLCTEQDGVFRDVALGAVMCCNPRCVNVGSCSEADLGLKARGAGRRATAAGALLALP